jgi:hypothetical protein
MTVGQKIGTLYVWTDPDSVHKGSQGGIAMLNWYDLETRADTVLEEIAVAEITARHLEEAGVDEESESTTIRRKLAGAFISLGAKIDREALETTRAA